MHFAGCSISQACWKCDDGSGHAAGDVLEVSTFQRKILASIIAARLRRHLRLAVRYWAFRGMLT